MKKLITTLAALSLIVVMFSGCATKAPLVTPTAVPSTVPTANPLTVTDFLDRTVTLNATPKKIVSLTASNTELVYALGLQDMLVGVDAYSNYPDAAAKLDKVGDFNGPNVEKIISLEPDLILAGNKLQNDAVQQLSDKGLNVIAAEATTYEEIYKSIDMISSICGVTEKGAALEAQMRATEQQIKDLAKGKPAVSVYYVLSFGEYGDYTIGSNNFITDLLTLAGANVVTKNEPVAWPQYSIEKIIADNPDFLIYDTGSKLEDLQKATGYKDLSAIKNNKVIGVDADKMNRPANRCLDEALEIAKKLYS